MRINRWADVVGSSDWQTFHQKNVRSCKRLGKKAMQDPAVQAAHDKMRQAHKEFRDAMHAAMLKADPSIQPILNKIPQGNHRGI
jgi:hypothetical protein